MIESNYKLKPCPFCGGKAHFMIKFHSEKGLTRGWEFGIYCTKCNITSPKTSYKVEIQLTSDGQIEFVEDERCQAIEAWNRRVNDGTERKAD